MSRPRRSPRRRVRVRLALLYAEMFFVVGAALVGITYALVDHSLSAKPVSVAPVATQAKIDPNLAAACAHGKGLLSKFATSVPVSTTLDPGLVQQCKQAFNLGLRQGATQKRSQALARLLAYSLAALGLMTVAAGALGWNLAGRVLRPLQAITDAARGASHDNLDRRLGLQGPDDELKELADTFDSMLARLGAAMDNQRRFVANASHELRTPLTVMRTAVDVTLAKPTRTPEQLEAMAVEVRDGVAQAEALVEALLTLARSDRAGDADGVSAEGEFVDLATAAEDALEQASPVIQARRVTVNTTLGSAETSGDRVLLDRLVANLIDNAVRHNVGGGWIRVATGAHPEDASVFIAVANGGPRIPDDVVPRLFEPFGRLHDRLDGGDHGLGLGLSIVRSVTLAHRGQVEAQGPADGGLEIEVRLPASAGTGGGAP